MLIEKGGVTPVVLVRSRSLAGASPSERESPGACDKSPRDKVSHPGESYPQDIHN